MMWFCEAFIMVCFCKNSSIWVADERVVETGLKPVSTHVIIYGSPKSVTKTLHEPNTLHLISGFALLCKNFNISQKFILKR